MRYKLLALLAACAFFAYGWHHYAQPIGDQTVSYTPAEKKCFSGPAHSKYCIHRPAGGATNGNVAYFFHGRNLDENAWNDDTFYTALVQKYWQENHLTPPTVVTVSFGPFWLLVPKGAAPQSGLLEIFEKEILPAVEARTGKPRNRLVFGESMGGLNSMLVGLQNHGLFRRVAALCPAIYKGSPFDHFATVREFLQRTGADPKTIYGLMRVSKNYFATQAEWEASSPLPMLEHVDVKSSPEIYLSCGLYDKYGNFEGSELFAHRAAERGLKISWRPLYGGHCVIDIPSLAEFVAAP